MVLILKQWPLHIPLLLLSNHDDNSPQIRAELVVVFVLSHGFQSLFHARSDISYGKEFHTTSRHACFEDCGLLNHDSAKKSTQDGF